MQKVGAVALDLNLNEKGFNSQLKSIGNMAKKVGATIAGAFAIKKVVDFGKDCIELGSDLTEVQTVVDVAFPKMNKTIDKFAKNAASQFGLSETMAKRYAGTFGSMSRPYGVIVTNQYCPYGVNCSIKGSIGAGFFVQNAIRSTTSGERLYFVTCVGL